DSFYGHLVTLDALTNERQTRYPAMDGLASGGLLVDRSGKRFCDEELGGVHMANFLARRSDPQAFAICDARTWDESLQGDAVMPSPKAELEKRGGTVFRADSLGELAALVGLPGPTLTAAVDELHRFADGEIAGLPVERTLGRAWRGLREAPFVAIPVLAGITFTMGGPLIDRRARVLTKDGGHIDGLYVVGAAAGGFDGGTERVGYAGGLSRGAVTGRAAGEHNARAPA
ncbi:MAG: FAD-binding protein, partial [Phenylobacterium sp.]